MQDRLTFLNSLRFWTFHVALNAAPSFLIACDILKQKLNIVLVAMTAGVVSFILAYSLVTSSAWFALSIGNGLFGKVLRLATRIRSGIAVTALLSVVSVKFRLVPEYFSQLMSLEMLAGFQATVLVERFGKLTAIRNIRIFLIGDSPAERAKSVWLGGMDSFVPVYLTTITEGLILSLVILLLAAVIYFILKCKNIHSRRNRKASSAHL